MTQRFFSIPLAFALVLPAVGCDESEDANTEFDGDGGKADDREDNGDQDTVVVVEASGTEVTAKVGERVPVSVNAAYDEANDVLVVDSTDVRLHLKPGSRFEISVRPAAVGDDVLLGFELNWRTKDAPQWTTIDTYMEGGYFSGVLVEPLLKTVTGLVVTPLRGYGSGGEGTATFEFPKDEEIELQIVATVVWLEEPRSVVLEDFVDVHYF